MSYTPQHKAHMEKVRGELAAHRKRRTELVTALRTADRSKDATVAGALESELVRVNADIEMSTQLENTLLRQMSGISDGRAAGTFLDDPTIVQELESLAHSRTAIGNRMLGQWMSKEQLAELWSSRTLASVSTPGDAVLPTDARLGPSYGVVPQLRRRLRLLDVMPTSPMDGQAFYYTQEAGSFDTAAETLEETIKPEGDLGLNENLVVAQTIAHWIKTARQAISDVPLLAQTIQTRLVYGVSRRVENQIIAGTGQGGTLMGILRQPGLQTIDFSTGVPWADLTLDAISSVLSVEGEPNAVILHPDDHAAMLKWTADGSGVRLDSGGAFTPGAGQTLWDVPVIASTVMPRGQALVGDFTQARLFIREAVNIRISDADQDDFVRNRLTILAEGRFGVAVWQPQAFALVQLAGPAHTLAVALAPASIPADGATTSTVTVTITDADGDPVGGQTVTLTATNGVTVGDATDNRDGTYSATLEAGTTTGTSTVTANDGTVSGTATLTLPAAS